MPVLNRANAIRLGSIAADRVYSGRNLVWPPPYLNPSIGAASTPDPGPLPTQHVVVYGCRHASFAQVLQTYACQWSSGSQASWLYRRRSSGTQQVTLSTTGANIYVDTQTLALPLVTANDMEYALAVNLTSTPCTATPWARAPGGVWTSVGGASFGATAPFDASAPVTIGRRGDVTTDNFQGRLYYCEMRTGLDPTKGTVLWRFDANEYPGSGLSYTDPRGRVWTLSAAGAIVPGP